MRLIQAQKQAEFFQVIRIRSLVFVQEQAIDVMIEHDDKDDHALHWLLLDDSDRPAGTCRVLLEEGAAVCGRVAILPEYRQQGAGKIMMLALEEAAPIRKSGCIQVHAQRQVEGFYLHCGYTSVGEPFYEAGIEHILMEKRL